MSERQEVDVLKLFQALVELRIRAEFIFYQSSHNISEKKWCAGQIVVPISDMSVI